MGCGRVANAALVELPSLGLIDVFTRTEAGIPVERRFLAARF